MPVTGTFIDAPVQGLSYTAGGWTARETSRAWSSIASSADGSMLAAAVRDGQIYTSTDSGATWTARDSNRGWTSITSSSDGSKLAAVAYGGQIYTSTDSGATWTARENKRNWQSITSSSDGSKLAAVVIGDKIYTSTDSGATWTARDSNRTWLSITSSSDGSKLAAGTSYGQIYTSTDSGATWTARQNIRTWRSITSSSDGSKLAAVAVGDNIYTYGTPTTKLTSATGSFDCTTGQDVTFSLGNQVLGAVKCGEAVHVYHMAGAGDSVEKGVRVARLLQSLNTSSDTSKIVLPDLTGITVNVRLDTNDTDFESDVQALMTALSGKGLVNTAPVTRATAVAHVQTELDKLSAAQKTSLCTTNHCNSELLNKLLNPAAVQVSVTGLTTGQTIELQMVAGSTTQTLKLQGTTGTTLSGGFATVPTTGQSYTVSRSDTEGAISCTGISATGTYDALSPPSAISITCSTNTPVNTTIGGTVSGLGGSQSVTLKNGSDTVTVSANGSYLLPTAVTAGREYRVEVSAVSPSNLQCTVSNGSGTAPNNVYSPSTSTVSNIAVSCQVTGYSVSGTVTGLTSSDTLGLVLSSSDSNADKRVVSITGSSIGAAYTFTNVVASGSTFSLALDGSDPSGYTCTVSPTYATAVAISANVTDADVVCVSSSGGGGTPPSGGGGASCGTSQTLPGSLNGTVTGLSASGLSSLTLTSVVTGSTVATVNYSSGCTSQVFTFDTLLGAGTSYDVQATAQGYTCTITNGSGTMGASPAYVEDVTVSCQ